MSEELSIVTATPDVTLTKTLGGRNIEVRAVGWPPTMSLRYNARAEAVPTVNEKLLVAVLAGVYPSWLASSDPETLAAAAREEPVPITFEAVSAAPRKAHAPPLEDEHDTLHITTVSYEGMTRLSVVAKNESGSVTHAAIRLSKGQVTSMLAALLAIYPRLQEN